MQLDRIDPTMLNLSGAANRTSQSSFTPYILFRVQD